MLGYIALPVIWRGIAFRFGNYALCGGRRVAIHEFPTRDEPFTEDWAAASGNIGCVGTSSARCGKPPATR